MNLLFKTCLLISGCCISVFAIRAQRAAPPDSPCSYTYHDGQITLNYNHQNIFTATTAANIRCLPVVQNTDGKVEQVFILESGDETPILLKGVITGSTESFACEADYPRKTLPVVRHSSGQSHNGLNRAVYDRQSDWVLSVDLPAATSIIPTNSNNQQLQYAVEATAGKLVIRFRPRFYQRHKGLSYFEPWKYKVWDKPVVGWCSWFAYLNSVTEQNIHTVADSLSKTLLPFGYQYLQIDDGYQQEPIGMPAHWLQANNKFPSGLAALASYISSKGLKPGIWTNVSCADSAFANSHSQWFVKNSDNKPAIGEWIGYSMDGSNPETIRQLINPVYSALRNEGWAYFKVDALRHLKYEGYNSYRAYFNQKGKNRDDAYREIVKSIRRDIGPGAYLLGCWGIRPELIGLIDGCRIGNDGFSYAGLAQFNSFNNVVWRNDPDHVELTDAEAYRSCSVTSLTGSVLLLTDKPERYKGRILEAARRTAPVLFTKPGQVYEVDPSRIQSLQRVSMEVSGDGPRVFDAGYTALTELYALEINRPFENWLLLGRMNDRNSEISLADLGLQKNRPYFVFEFWTKKFVGQTVNNFSFPPIDSNFHCQVFCFREKLNHPQVLATSRHISCGGLELKDCKWKNDSLSGESEVVAGDPYTIYIHVPDGFTVSKITSDTPIVNSDQEENILTICLKSDTPANAKWSVAFVK